MSAGARPSTPTVWGAFVVVHAALALVGVVVAPLESFWDVDLYRWWMYLALDEGRWPVLDEPWVYPAGAVLPMLLPALGTTVSTPGYALGWVALVTALDAAAVAALVRRGTRGRRAALWWLAFLALLGPVAIGRLDGVVAPLLVLGLLSGASGVARGPAADDDDRPRVWGSATLLTLGAWVKVAPGPLLLPLAAAARRPWRDVVGPAAAVTALVVGAVAAGGGLPRVLGFLTTQRGRGLQVESVAATPWTLAATVRDDVVVELDEVLVTYQVHGPGTGAAAAALDVLLVLAVLAVGVVLVLGRRRGTARAALLPASLTLLLVLVVANKVGSPQFMAWLGAGAAALLAAHPAPPHAGRARTEMSPSTARGRAHAAEGDLSAGGSDGAGASDRQRRGLVVVGLAVAGLTQVVFPWGYPRLITGDPLLAGVLGLRNALVVVLLALAGAALARAVRGTAGPPPDPLRAAVPGPSSADDPAPRAAAGPPPA